MNRRYALTLALAAGLVGTTGATAQTTASCHSATCGTTGAAATNAAQVSVTINTVLYISVSNPSGTSITLGAITADDFNAGFKTATDASTITTAGNVAHDLQVTGAVTNTAGTKPLADLRVCATQIPTGVGTANVTNGCTTTATTSSLALSTTAQDLVTGITKGKHGTIGATTFDQPTVVRYLVELDYATDAPNDVTTYDVTYTVVAS